MKYKIKTDLWIRILLWGCILMFVPMYFFAPAEEMWILALSTFLMAVFILPLFSASYELAEQELIIKFYFFKFRIKYENIKSIRKCKNFLSSAAMSSERIEILEHNKGKLKGTTYISPVNRDDFYTNLKHNCRHLEVDHDEDSLWKE
ncbi:hypothetical protein KQ51_01574 [Candidatus Izimaplasma bacterium HR1]|jgi:hypothetical protein|uniref:PH domain-containing protein n=1 Tax=Candidatus Izimoplasma sp. HR1 TaxID=1541959 RepID=UPI0004F5EA3D|nr:hypothetical protein KQ51_01574 [Candidatus Izimaplasma bacterium HR1]